MNEQHGTDEAGEGAAVGLPLADGFEVLELIARGGHGSVYLARQHATGDMVALKVLDARFGAEDTYRRFEREVEALSRISDHPGVAGPGVFRVSRRPRTAGYHRTLHGGARRVDHRPS